MIILDLISKIIKKLSIKTYKEDIHNIIHHKSILDIYVDIIHWSIEKVITIKFKEKLAIHC